MALNSAGRLVNNRIVFEEKDAVSVGGGVGDEGGRPVIAIIPFILALQIKHIARAGKEDAVAVLSRYENAVLAVNRFRRQRAVLSQLLPFRSRGHPRQGTRYSR